VDARHASSYVRRVRPTGFPVLWICGAPGAGKSVAAWAVFEELTADGHRVAYVDIDQLGMLYPAPDDDPMRHKFKVEALSALVPGYVSAGAQYLVVSGVIDPEVGPASTLTGDVDLTLCLLSPGSAALRERLRARGWDNAEADEAVSEDASLRRAAFVDTVVETDGLTVADTAKRLRTFVVAPESPAGRPCSTRTSPAGIDIVVVTGPRTAGSSTIGFGLASRRWGTGLRTGFLDLQQLGFIADGDASNVTDVSLAINQLARLHRLFSARGAGRLVVTGHLGVGDRAALRAVFTSAWVRIVRLRADAVTFGTHIGDRVAGSAARLAGDDLLGADQQHQAAVLAAAVAEQERLDAEGADDVTVDVTDRSAGDAISALERLLATDGGWP
jgi:broad-specificity NMP kinase